MEEMYYYRLHQVTGIGRHTYQKILNYVTPKELYEGNVEKIAPFLSKKQVENMRKSIESGNIHKEWEILKKKNIQVLGYLQNCYPEKLTKISDPPPVLYCKGNGDLLNRPSVAVIGARACSNYGSLMAKELGRKLAAMGIVVVSGMARGIDGICQESCLEYGGTSIGVLGSGVEVCYPPENKPLYEKLQVQGALISENLPFTKPSPGLFPLRNRIISGLADIIVVIEARAKSGTLITVDMALEQGKEVYVIPGRITDNLSFGCNRLIKQGAGMICSIDEFLEEIAPLLQTRHENMESPKPDLSGEEKAILKAIDVTYKTMEEIFCLVKKEFPAITIVCLMELLLELQIKQWVKEEAGYYYCPKRIL